MDDTTPKRGPGRPRTRKPRPPKKTAKLEDSTRVITTMSAAQHGKLGRLAAKAGITASEWVRRKIDDEPE